MSVCDCPVAAASLKFLKQEGLSAAPSVKLPGYRGNGLEGIFKDTVAQQLLQVIQVFSPVLLTFLPLGFFVQSVQWWNELEFVSLHCIAAGNIVPFIYSTVIVRL